MNFNKIKNKISAIFIFFFLVVNGLLIDKNFSYKRLFVLSLTVMMIVWLFFDKYRIRKFMNDVVYSDNDKPIKKITLIILILAWSVFSASFVADNIGYVWTARYLMLAFLILIFVSVALTIYDLLQTTSQKIKNAKVIFFSGTSILYAVCNVFSASWFLQLSNLNIDDSPLVGMGWKITFFAVYYSIFLQFTTFCGSLYVWNLVGVSFYRKAVSIGLLCVTTFLMLGMSQWNDNFMVFILDLTTKFEWHKSAICGTKIISEPTEHYFGFNTEKYTVYFSNRKGKWGFEELMCKSTQQHDDISRIPVREFDMQKWFKDK